MGVAARKTVGACAVAIAFLACEPLIGIDFERVQERSSPACELKKPKQRSDSADFESRSPLTFVLVQPNYGDLREVDGEPEYLSLGYDLDNSCTGRGDPSSCNVPSWIKVSVDDGPHGQDNGAGRILLGQNAEYSRQLINSATLNVRESEGTAAPMAVLRISNYNGTSYDPSVKAEWFVALAAESAEPPFVPGDFSKVESWPIDRAFVASEAAAADSVQAKIVDEDAYVEKFQLVARFDSAIWPLLNAHIEINEVLVTATFIPPLDENLPEDVTVAGKVSMTHILGASPELMKQMALELPVPCTDAPHYSQFKQFICAGADIALGTGSSCNAASFGVAFQAKPALIGQIKDRPPPEALCAKAVDPRFDSCESLEPQSGE